MQSLKSPGILTTSKTNSPLINFQFSSTDLEKTVNYYQNIIADGDESSHNYWYLGLAYLLQERELDAQSTWFIPFDEVSELESAALNIELVSILDRSASEEFGLDNIENSWLISQYLRELDPIHLSNLFRSILLSIELKQFTSDILLAWNATEILSTSDTIDIDRELLSKLLRSLLYYLSKEIYSFIKSCLLFSGRHFINLTDEIANEIMQISNRIGSNTFMIEILEFCRNLQPESFNVLNALCRVYSNLGYDENALAISYLFCNTCDLLPDKIRADYTTIVICLKAGDWKTASLIFNRYQESIEKFTIEKYCFLNLDENQGIMISTKLFPYIDDRPAYYRQLQNQVAKIYLTNNQTYLKKYHANAASLLKQPQIIRIGYVGSTLRSHSVGWLSRWLFQYHDRQKFQVFTYFINQDPNDIFSRKWFQDLSHVSYYIEADGEKVAAQIRADQIDILIDLDSLTLDTTCQVLAAKPAPVQVSWLGWDATGLSTVDYFIADPYVLPAHAQDYYQENIWRLPQTYLAVNGFEVGIPTLKRRDLNIPDRAVIYWSGQRGFKRHPDTVRAQMQILKQVPNSYFIIKGDTDPTIIQEFFGKIATEEGVDFDRLRFVGNVADESTHRANLAIADIVLDTFPYNGATTTLETLWMGIPMVTQVGQQFAARNSYTFMLNAGITEGIAWNEQEYVEWGVKLGLDRDLRDRIAGKLRSGRTTAPVWNAKQFTLDMEQAYSQMWVKYQEQGAPEVIEDYSNN
jgi:predicted O-linked N-acetylglucosamine transferase (SPINDLY family)